MDEIEAKFYVSDLIRIETRIQELGARLIQPRIFEINMRFDQPDGRLRSEGQVLRLRQDTEARLTYKSGGVSANGIISRREIEFTVEDFDKAKLFLEALGYQKLFIYEKYRTTYLLESNSLLSENRKQASGIQSCHIMFDELPYGNFIEIEGEDFDSIGAVAKYLELDMKTSVTVSYAVLFERAKQNLNLPFDDLTFENFKNLHIATDNLQVQPADR